jgi:thiamine biosynthesis lipoprotein
METRFWSMGTIAHLAVEFSGHDRHVLILARSRLEQLERLWSRFIPASDVSRLNRADGQPVRVDAATVDLLERARHAWEWSGGLFDPTIHDALVSAGYDRTFETLMNRPHRHVATAPAGLSASGLDDLRLDKRTRLVSLPAGVHIDLGGIAKGYAADLMAAELVDRAVTGASVNLGGDLRVVGQNPAGGPWQIGIADPLDPTSRLCTVLVDNGAVATSSTCRRRWQHPQGDRHHLIDPRTSRPTTSGLAAVTVIAAEASWAEVGAKAALVAGLAEGPDLLSAAGLAGLFVTDAGELVATDDFVDHIHPGSGCTFVTDRLERELEPA